MSPFQFEVKLHSQTILNMTLMNPKVSVCVGFFFLNIYLYSREARFMFGLLVKKSQRTGHRSVTFSFWFGKSTSVLQKYEQCYTVLGSN